MTDPVAPDEPSRPMPSARADHAAIPSVPAVPAVPSGAGWPAWALWALVVVAVLALATAGLSWQRLGHIQEQLARQSADAAAAAVEARTLARQAETLSRDAVARVATAEARLAEVALQRRQLEDLMQSLSRSRDENLVVDIDSAIRLAQQQAQLAGSIEPLVAALRTAEQRVARSAQPRLVGVQRALTRDLERLRATPVADTPGLLVKLDELTRLVDELPLSNAAPSTGSAPTRAVTPRAAVATASAAAAGDGDGQGPGWRLLTDAQGLAQHVLNELRALVRVSRIEQPDAILLAPEQAFFVRENLKLKLLNARLGALSRQPDSMRIDLAAVEQALQRYFDRSSRRVLQALSLVQQLQTQARNLDLPRVDDSLAALAAAATTR